MKRTASKVLPAQPRRRFPALGRERGAGRAGGAGRARGPDTSPALPGLRAAAPRPGVLGGDPAPGALPGARRDAQGAALRSPRLRRLHNGAGRGEPSRTAGSGLRNRCSPDPVSPRAEEPRPLLGVPLRTPAPGPGPGSPRHAPGHRGIPGRARGSVEREAPERPPASPGRCKVIPAPARSRGPAREREPLPRLTASLYFCRAAWSFFSL